MAWKVLRRGKKVVDLIRDARLLESKREEIAGVALDLFLQEGFHAATTREVARRAGVSVGGLFTYFASKENILVYIITREQERAETELLNALDEQVERAKLDTNRPEAVFIAVCETFIRAVDRMRKFILLAYQETKSLDRRARESLMEHERRLQKILGRAIEYGVSHGRFPPGGVDLKAHSVMVLGHAWAVRRWAFAGVADSVDEYIRFLEPQVLALLKSRAGRDKAAIGGRLRRGRATPRPERDSERRQIHTNQNVSEGEGL